MVNYVVVGGGVAGVCCAEELCRLCPDDTVTLVAVDRILKGVSTVARISRTLEELKIVEKSLDALPYPNLRWVQGVATGIDTEKKVLAVAGRDPLPYDKLCVATGARPRRLLNSPHVTVLRDTDSVDELAARLRTARRVVVVGNGGIALELAHGLRGVDVTWVVRHGHIGDAFFDLDAAQFFLEELQRERHAGAAQPSVPAAVAASAPSPAPPPPATTAIEAAGRPTERERALGHAVGPAWTRLLPPGAGAGAFSVELRCEVAAVEAAPPGSAAAAEGAPYAVTLSDGRVLPADVIVSVIGVAPAVDWVPPEIPRDPQDGGLLVDEGMETRAAGVFAAGDACRAAALEAASPHWFQMRLWGQARAQGVWAAHCMAGVRGQTGGDMAFEVFTHVTRFLGKKVVLLGLYNGQRLEGEPEEDMVSYSRVDEGGRGGGGGGGCCGKHGGGGGGEGDGGRSFVRVLLLRGRVQGAVLIGDTELAETMENLILDGLDVGRYGPEMLDPDAELDHIFD